VAIPDLAIWQCRKDVGSTNIPPGAEPGFGRDNRLRPARSRFAVMTTLEHAKSA
jgi:hypothetical protein